MGFLVNFRPSDAEKRGGGGMRKCWRSFVSRRRRIHGRWCVTYIGGRIKTQKIHRRRMIYSVVFLVEIPFR